MAMPSRTRWLLGAVAAIALYVFVDDYCWSTARDLDRKADRLQALLDRGAAMRQPMPREIERGVVSFGLVEPPDSEAQSSQALAAAVSEVVKRHNIQNYSFEARSGGKLPSAALGSVVGPGQRVERIFGELSFDVAPGEVAKILQDLEMSPAVDAIAQVRMNWREEKKKLDVKLSVEAWAVVSRDARGRGT
ncbi:MAG: hypothetical protein FGM37_04505 [Phycisphaerales bacterium]|nr:hypothetical protein [Phycisphaerales bacterium]